MVSHASYKVRHEIFGELLNYYYYLQKYYSLQMLPKSAILDYFLYQNIIFKRSNEISNKL